jgi:hypothetical protein
MSKVTPGISCLQAGEVQKLGVVILSIMLFVFVTWIILDIRSTKNVTGDNVEARIRLLDQNGNNLVTWYPVDSYTLKDGFCSFTFEGINYEISGQIIIQTKSKIAKQGNLP